MRLSQAPSGAVRRSETARNSRNLRPAILSLAALLCCGALVWATSESQSFISTSEPVQESAHVAPRQPAFFFDDAQDALGSTRQIHQEEQTETVARKFRNTVNEEAHAIASMIKDTVTGETDAIESINQGASENEADAVANIIRDTGIDEPASVMNTNIDNVENVAIALEDGRQSMQARGSAALRLSDNQALVNSSPQTQTTDSPKTPAELSVHLPGSPEFGEVISITSFDTDPSQSTNPQIHPSAYQVTVSPGDTLSGILNDNGLSLDQMQTLLEDDTVRDDLSNIHIDQVFNIARDIEGNFKSLTTRVSDDHKINITRTDAGFNVQSVELPIKTERVVTSGSIDQSLFLAAEKADIKQSTIMELANVFQWDLDFERDIQKDDRFSLIYDKQFREGEYIGDGDILAAEFIRGSVSHIAIRVDKEDGVSGYYSPDGQSKRRTFMRHPVDVVRITSKFDPNRLHPVLHQIRAHRGVDYGSPYGSPIYATADGKVTHSGTKGAYGNTVILKHGEKFSTLYAHMSRISDKSKIGARVNQGDVIGYVGNTGRVTGTHLHYEFRVYGEQIDPLEIKLPAAQPLAEKYMPQLEQRANELSELMTASIESGSEQVVSSNELQDDIR